MLSRMTPKLFTCGEGETEELSMVREKVLTLARVDLVPRRRISVLLQFNLRKFEVNHMDVGTFIMFSKHKRTDCTEHSKSAPLTSQVQCLSRSFSEGKKLFCTFELYFVSRPGVFSGSLLSPCV